MGCLPAHCSRHINTNNDPACAKPPSLSSAKLAEIFDGGLSPIPHCENPKTRPPLALVKFPRVLVWHPALLAKMRTGS